MFWADRIAKEIQETRTPKNGRSFVIRDEKTMSGRVHIGSMRGVAIHGAISEVLSEYGVANEYLYELNDFDHFDAIPGYLSSPEIFEPYLGKPLYAVPSPEPGSTNFPEYFAKEFVEVHKKGGFTPSYYWAAKDLYATGSMDPMIRVALERAADVRRILKDVSGSIKDDTWLPITVLCEVCGKIATTRVYDFDGETVGYTCDRMPDGAVPCGNSSRIAPWRGNAKLFWKVDWAAKWVARGVDIEGAGKDHSTKGGSRDAADHIARELYDFEPPFNIPYEFFLVGGKKMSSSKGRGSSAHEMAELFPPEVFRLTLLGKDINQQIEIDPAGDSVPRTYDWYDDLALGEREGKADDFSRLYALCQLPEERAELEAHWQLRFSQVAFMVQMPHLDLYAEAETVKGESLTEEERSLLEERANYARFWLADYAPDEFKYELQRAMPAVALSDTQKKALRHLAEFMAGEQKTGEEIHLRLHELKTETPIAAGELFAAIYQIFLGRTSGPKAGWFLSVLPRDMVLARLHEASFE